MPTTQISTTLSKADRETVMAAVNTIKEKLPFLVDLNAEERKALPKMGDKSRTFVSKALEVATQNPDFLPRSFDVEELRKDVQLFEAMYSIVVALTQLQELGDFCERKYLNSAFRLRSTLYICGLSEVEAQSIG